MIKLFRQAVAAALSTVGAMLLLAVAPVSGHAGASDGGQHRGSHEQPTLAERCAAFAPTALPHRATMTSTEMRSATEFSADVCIVRGTIVSSPNSTINWAVELPDPSLWNRRTVTLGGGGFDGFIPTDRPSYHQILGKSARHYVKMSSDSGHQTRTFEWAVDDVALENHAYEANHMVLGVGTRLARTFYRKGPIRRYMFGHSNGGRSGLVSTQRYPKDYDGVLALQPAISQQAHEANLVELNRHIFGNPENWLSPAKVALFAEAEIKACDGLDGLEDGIIGNIEACQYVPTDLLCTGPDNDGCLTAGQIETIRLIYSDHHVPVELADGIEGYPRFGRGGAATTDWNTYLFGRSFEGRSSFNYFVGDQAAEVVTGDPDVDYMSYDVTAYQDQWLRLSRQIDATDPDLSAFARHGGKLLIWYGVADSCVSLYRTSQYLRNVQQRVGTERAREFVRLLTSPAVGHGLNGPGSMSVDLFGALVAWTEQDDEPDDLIAAKFAPGTSMPLLERPVCEFPKFPRYDGSGDPSEADNFSCSTD